jgi:hypothetical protein
MSEKKKLKKELDYQVGSGITLTCSKIGGNSTSLLLAAGDDQSMLTVWQLAKQIP